MSTSQRCDDRLIPPRALAHVWVGQPERPGPAAPAPGRPVAFRGGGATAGLSRQNAPVPSGVPRPVGPSHPVPAVHRGLPPQLPLLPDVTSLSDDVWLYG